MTLLDTDAAAPRRAAGDDEGLMMASLDHAMWFHRPFRADEWLLYDQGHAVDLGRRGLAHGLIFTERRRTSPSRSCRKASSDQ